MMYQDFCQPSTRIPQLRSGLRFAQPSTRIPQLRSGLRFAQPSTLTIQLINTTLTK